jgi:hypothetical protein
MQGFESNGNSRNIATTPQPQSQQQLRKKVSPRAKLSLKNDPNPLMYPDIEDVRHEHLHRLSAGKETTRDRS